MKTIRVVNGAPSNALTVAKGDSVLTTMFFSNNKQSENKVQRLERENQQLRQELVQAHARIQELQSSLLVVIRNVDESDEDETISVASSTSTLPTGSLLAEQERWKQLQRDERRVASWQRQRKEQQYRYCKKLPTWSEDESSDDFDEF